MEETNDPGSVNQTASSAVPASSPGVVALPQFDDGGWSPQVQRSVADSAVAAGQMSRAQADEMLRAGGIEPNSPGHAIAKEGIAGEIDSFFPPASKPTDYQIPSTLTDHSKMPTAADIQFTKQAGEWLYTARLPANLGSAIASEVKQYTEKTSGMSGPEYQLHVASEDLKLQNIWGSETNANINLAVQLAREVDRKSPGFLKYLEQSRAFDSAAVVIQWGEHAKRLGMRVGGSAVEAEKNQRGLASQIFSGI